MHVITLFFHGAFDENIFIPIRAHQDGLERRERHPSRVDETNLDGWLYDINATLTSDGEGDENIFISV